jgi:hypothetical protein
VRERTEREEHVTGSFMIMRDGSVEHMDIDWSERLSAEDAEPRATGPGYEDDGVGPPFIIDEAPRLVLTDEVQADIEDRLAAATERLMELEASPVFERN